MNPLSCTWLLLTLFATTSGAALACQRQVLGDQVVDDQRNNFPNIDRPDYNFNGTGTVLRSAFRCSAGPFEMQVDVPLTGLTYVHDITHNGVSIPTYAFSDRSPLVGFVYQTPGSGVPVTPLQVGRTTVLTETLPADTDVSAGVLVLYFFRGGAMESVPYQHLGTVEAWPTSDPAQRLRSPISLGFTLAAMTCRLSNATLALDDVSADDLALPGSSAKETALDMTMNCPAANVDVTLSLTDAHDAGNTGSLLQPVAGSSAQGVRIELLRGGVPVQLGQAWSHGYSSKGDQAISFSARYRRTSEALAPGTIVGEAVLQADYR